MKRLMNWAVAPVFGMMLFTLGCVEIDPAEAQKAIEVGRQMRDLQNDEVRPLMTSLDQLRGDEMEPLYFRMEELSRQQEQIYRERIQPLERQINRLHPDDRAFFIQQEEFDAQMREIMQLEQRIEAESWQLDRQRRRQELELRVGSEDAMRAKQDVIEGLRMQLHELYRTGQRSLDELYRKQSELYAGYSDPYHDSDEAARLRQELAEIEWKIADSQVGFDDSTSALHQEIRTLEWEAQQLRQALDDLEWQRIATLDQLEALYRQLEVSFSGGTVSGSLEQGLMEIRASLSALDPNDPEVQALTAELVQLEALLGGGGAFELQLAAMMQEISGLEAEVSRLHTVIGEQQMLLFSKNETLTIFYVQLDELRASVSTTGTAVEGTSLTVDPASVEAQIAALEVEIAAFEGEIFTITLELDENTATKQSMALRLDALYQEIAVMGNSGMDEAGLYQWMEEIRFRLSNLVVHLSSDVQALQNELAGIEAQITQIEAAFHNQVTSLEQEIAVLEAEIAQIKPPVEQLEMALYAAYGEIELLHLQLNGLYVAGNGLGESYARIEEIEGLLAASYPDSDIWGPLSLELSALEALVFQVEAAFQAEVSALEEAKFALEAEAALLQQQFDVQALELSARYDRLEGLHVQLNSLYHADANLDYLYNRREQIYLELDSVTVVTSVSGSYAPPGYGEEQQQAIAALEDEMQRISNAIRQYESALHSSQSRLQELYGKIDGAYRAGGDVEHLYRRMDEINARLAELSGQTVTGGSYDQELATIEQEIARMETRFRDATRALEDRIADLEMEMYGSQRDMEQRWSLLNQEMEWAMLELDDQRFQLQERRWAMEERMWGSMDGVRAEADRKRWALEDELNRIYAEELQPLEDSMRDIEMELRELERQEQSIYRSLDAVESQYAPMEREMEDIAFNILEGLVTQFGGFDGSDVEEEAAPAPVSVDQQ